MGGCETNSVENLLLQHDAPVLAGLTVVRPGALWRAPGAPPWPHLRIGATLLPGATS